MRNRAAKNKSMKTIEPSGVNPNKITLIGLIGLDPVDFTQWRRHLAVPQVAGTQKAQRLGISGFLSSGIRPPTTCFRAKAARLAKWNPRSVPHFSLPSRPSRERSISATHPSSAQMASAEMFSRQGLRARQVGMRDQPAPSPVFFCVLCAFLRPSLFLIPVFYFDRFDSVGLTVCSLTF
jgi:hypothetical protein